jgi:hypothetical protein
MSESIRPGELWPIALLHRQLGWGARSRAAAIRQGLVVHRWGKYAYVPTDSLIAFLRANDRGQHMAVGTTERNRSGEQGGSTNE